MRLYLLMLPVALAACSGPNAETLLAELRVVASIPDKPEVAPGEENEVTATVVDPLDQGFDLVVWTCVPSAPGEPCLDAGAPLDGRAAVVRDAGSSEVVSIGVPELLLPALQADGAPEEIPVTLWTLACIPDACPIVETLETALLTPAGSAAREEARALLGDPTSMLQALPLEGVAAATRPVIASLRSEELRNQNPVITAAPSELEGVTSGGRLEFQVEATDEGALSAFGYTTAGGFEERVFEGSGGVMELAWLPGDEAEAGPVGLYVVVQDDAGGEALWRGDTRIDAP